MAPASSNCLALTNGAPKRRWWLKVRSTPRSAQARASALASPHVLAMGFSQWMALTPAAAAASTISRCWPVHVQTLTTSRTSRSSMAR